MSKALAVIGAQFGSEGKGRIVQHLADDYDIHVRVGGPNAGHTIVHDGKVYKMRSIPCGWVNPNALLVIGRGAVIDIDVLESELNLIRGVDPGIDHRLLIDANAWCITNSDRYEETNRGMQATIGSTLEGVGAARIKRMLRDEKVDFRFVRVVGDDLSHLVHGDTAQFLWDEMHSGAHVLLEGTQGSGLSLVHGHWPYVTSADTNAAQLAADCGIAPSMIGPVLLVARTFPIRVGGNSGPLADELTWEKMSQMLHKQVEETTTVTGRKRRIGLWNMEEVRKAVRLNNPAAIALTFLDYIYPGYEGAAELPPQAEAYVGNLEHELGVGIPLVCTGGPQYTISERSVTWRNCE